MKKLTLILGIAVVAALATVTAQSAGDGAERAEGLARNALADCISDARAAGNDISISSFAGAGEGDWFVRFCSNRRDISHTAQRVGDVVIEGWEVVSATCEFPAPTNNPCF